MEVPRHAARKRALDVLFESDLRRRPLEVVLHDHRQTDDPPPPFAVELVVGVDAHWAELDELIVAYARDWRLDRMPIVDRNLLRLALYELLHTDVPVAVAIDEAVRLAKELSTEDSGRFVNGLLAKVIETRKAGT